MRLLVIYSYISLMAYAGITSAYTVPVYFDATTHWHRDIVYHPEQPERIKACVKEIITTLLAQDNEHADDSPVRLINIGANLEPNDFFDDTINNRHHKVVTHEPFSQQELDHALDMLLQIHDKDLVLQLQERCNNSKQQRLAQGKDSTLGFMGYIDDDTYTTTESFDVCWRATAAWIRSVNNVKANDTKAAFCLTRPPGHHATSNYSNGFCLYNFAAAAAVHALGGDNNDNIRVSIIDWDVHYGQGVADIVSRREYRDNIRYVSIHQTPAFPYQGERLETIHNVMTIPIQAYSSWDNGYKEKYRAALDFSCNKDWVPDIVIVCAGYDALDSDELASCSLKASDYYSMTNMLYEHLRPYKSDVPAVVFGLEGGYQLGENAAGGNLQQAVVATIQAIVEQISGDLATKPVDNVFNSR